MPSFSRSLLARSLGLSSLCVSALLPVMSFAAQATPPNIIMVVGDGMGPVHTSAFRYFHDDPATPQVESTVFDRHFVGRSSTYPALSQGLVTDSAASGTALASGHKTYNGAIGLDNDQQPVESVLEYAKAVGKSTGLVVTSQINHATPASYVAHVPQRRMYNEIADSYFDAKIDDQFKVNVMLGGGWQYFIRDDRNLVEEFQQAGYQYIDSYAQLATIDNHNVLGLFADRGLPAALDEANPDRLKDMVQAAVSRLETNDKGFFLLVEGSQIDWASHANDVASTMAEMDDLHRALLWLETYVSQHPNTLVVVTADHNTGGMTMGERAGGYRWEPAYLRQLSASPRTIAVTHAEQTWEPASLNQQLGFTLTKEEMAVLQPAHKEGAKAFYQAIKQVVDQRTNTGWTTGGHTGVDVPVFAFGQGKEQFIGQMDNTDIAKKLFAMLGRAPENESNKP
ncbi:alkaline phosphatase [Photobacterium aphoticum]|uniref:Alkaline phosphatase n=1 Tax=Photobacterium aphoticum TaxID=754436 RepID=A0A0J1JAQ3_9GAMM|nr:alkaline phosphatase [Photobacterium aphoticum]KLU98586.1 alkaline phosphatase [Photobacterium aphoticum]PSU57504.1 alkaline phosphatase [Photobacterium aphoticum]GHA62438.1 alkaline phosphatase [Photobacterium aphoticum]